jgi:hypothetical protein
MGTTQMTFYDAVKRFLTEEWGRSCAGPWWEGGLQLDFGRSLMESLESARDLVQISPPFLGAWPAPIMTRKLAALIHQPGAHRGQYPDFTYWPPDDGEPWNIELKLWSVNGRESLDRQVNACIRGFEADASKVLDNPDGCCGFVLLAVNIPKNFAVGRCRRPYNPDDFKKELIKRIWVSELLKLLAAGGQVPPKNHGNWCAAIKTIDRESVEKVEVYSSVPDLALSPCP